MTDKYKTLIDKETWTFIELTGSFYPVDSEDKSIVEQRGFYNNVCRHFHAGYPDGVNAKDSKIVLPDRKIPIRSYHLSGVQPQAQVVYYHGGGYVLGGLDSHDDVCAELCDQTGFNVISIDYRLAPEHTYPDDFNDALAAFDYVSKLSDLPIVVAGDSAGGNLAAAVSHARRGCEHKPVGQVLIYPALGSDLNSGTFIEHAEAPMLTTTETKFYKKTRVGGHEELLLEPQCSPLNNTDFSDLPPTVIVSAQCDPLSGDGKAYHDKITSAGGKSIYHNETGLIHGYLRARHSVQRARESFARISEAVSLLGVGRWPE